MTPKINECGHPERPHKAKGMCANCYHQSPNPRKYRQDYADSNRRRDILKHRYGVSVEQWEGLNEQQSGKCAICGQPPRGNMKRLSVDHKHDTQMVRGLLCITCNRALGYLENLDWREKALAYLARPFIPLTLYGKP